MFQEGVLALVGKFFDTGPFTSAWTATSEYTRWINEKLIISNDS